MNAIIVLALYQRDFHVGFLHCNIVAKSADIFICFVFNLFKILNFDDIDLFWCYIYKVNNECFHSCMQWKIPSFTS